MKRHASSRSELLLLEILLAILFFAIASAICLQLFVKSHRLSLDTEAMNLSVTQAASCLAILDHDASPVSQMQDIYPCGTFTATDDEPGETLAHGQIYYDKNFQMVTSEMAIYTLAIDLSHTAENCLNYTFCCTKAPDQEVIYSTELVVHHPLRKDVTP